MKLNADGSATLNGITLTPEQVQEIKLAEPQPKRTPTITFAYTAREPFEKKLKGYPGVVFIGSKLYSIWVGSDQTLSLGCPINANENYRPWRLEVVE